ncbi:MAG TPA: hypothetical protein VFS16_18775, partial [Acidimicrobiia bacterium]|nr:hypothetical protein [Acidimicrobiia bacterium]
MLTRHSLGKPFLAAVLVGASTWAGASPAGVPAHLAGMQVAAVDLPVPPATTTSSSTTTSTAAPAPPTTVAPPPTTTAPAPTTTTAARR